MHSHLAFLIGECLNEHRHKLDITQKQMAKDLGISAQFLGRIEKGDVMAPRTVLIDALLMLNVSNSKITKIYKESAQKTADELIKKMGRRTKKKKSV